MIFIFILFIFNYYNQEKTHIKLINLNEIKGRSAISLIEVYEGINPYLKKLKQDYLKNKKLALTDNQTAYILKNHDK